MTREKRKRVVFNTSSLPQSGIAAVRRKLRTNEVHSCEVDTASIAVIGEALSEGAAGSTSVGDSCRAVGNEVSEGWEGNPLEGDVRTAVLRTLAKRKEGSSM